MLSPAPFDVRVLMFSAPGIGRGLLYAGKRDLDGRWDNSISWVSNLLFLPGECVGRCCCEFIPPPAIFSLQESSVSFGASLTLACLTKTRVCVLCLCPIASTPTTYLF